MHCFEWFELLVYRVARYIFAVKNKNATLSVELIVLKVNNNNNGSGTASFGIVLVSLLLTLNMFNTTLSTLTYCFTDNFKVVSAYWVYIEETSFFLFSFNKNALGDSMGESGIWKKIRWLRDISVWKFFELKRIKVILGEIQKIFWNIYFLSQLFTKLQMTKQEIIDIQEEHIKERQGLETALEDLDRAIKLK